MIPAVVTKIFKPIAGLAIPMEIAIKEAKAEMKTHPLL